MGHYILQSKELDAGRGGQIYVLQNTFDYALFMSADFDFVITFRCGFLVKLCIAHLF